MGTVIIANIIQLSCCRVGARIEGPWLPAKLTLHSPPLLRNNQTKRNLHTLHYISFLQWLGNGAWDPQPGKFEKCFPLEDLQCSFISERFQKYLYITSLFNTLEPIFFWTIGLELLSSYRTVHTKEHCLGNHSVLEIIDLKITNEKGCQFGFSFYFESLLQPC